MLCWASVLLLNTGTIVQYIFFRLSCRVPNLNQEKYKDDICFLSTNSWPLCGRMLVTAYNFPAYRLHYSLVISQRYTKATQRATKNNKSLCVTLCMLCGSLCSKSCFADANTGIGVRKYIRGYLKITSGMPNTQNGTRIKRIWRIFTECIGVYQYHQCIPCAIL